MYVILHLWNGDMHARYKSEFAVTRGFTKNTVTISGMYGPTNTPEKQNGFSFNQAWFEHGLNWQQQRPPSPSH